MKHRSKGVDGNLPIWLSSKILSAVDYIHSAKKEEDATNSSHTESLRRIAEVSEKFDSEEMCWVMMLLVLPKLNRILKNSDEFRDHTKMKEERTIQ